jgi:NADH-quinone oxidoreductase subunit M
VNILDFIILLPLFGVLAILMGMPARFSAIGVAAINLVMSLFVFCAFDREKSGEFQFAVSRTLIESPNLSLSFGVDGMSLILLLLSTIVTLAAVWMSPREDDLGKQARLYYISPLLISTGALGAFLSTDVFFFFAFHELALIPTFIMIGMLGHGFDRVSVAWKITIYLSVGSLVLLAGLLALVSALGADSFNFVALREAAAAAELSTTEETWIGGLLIVGFGTLISLFPFHSWAAPAYAAAPTPVAMLHSGVLKKFGLYGILRILLPLIPGGLEVWADWLTILLLGNILYIGFITLAQSRLDKMIGYSSVMHMGYVFLGIVSFNTIGINGAVLLMFAHGISVALLFGLAGQMRQQLPKLDLFAMGGMGKTAPFLCFVFGLGAFASIGLPGFANFTSELLVFFGAFSGYEGEGFSLLQTATVLALWGVVISAVYTLRAFRRVFQGEPVGDWKLHDLACGPKIAAALLVVVLLIVGIYPKIFLELLSGPVAQILGQR